MYTSRLAQFLYEKVRSLVQGRDTDLVTQVAESVGRIPRERVGTFLEEVDEHLIPRLAGASLLRLAQTIEAFDPQHIATHMPVLSAQTRHLSRAKELADLFQADALDRLIEALRAERASLEAS
jgi:hypothetical protein